ncbi:hypothetical protein CONPUDRAFT_92523 [Coniophora puteana RWD-64-598 SS2]|uniref:Uncharacterized protein n=1 Tax=Coniophora puteana (strain RWD-64-598) TaxID=741705 RepID=A0A5M3MEG4_CONPW|nr:uncharacterized protein CONPUDRAFT_92523 [Coniophora puteana RWD-64-598 SS2]EIW77396.1 hypothetical protein CONPUDRAFT_92523 [Coniophora puteana RWD-64-598 SS2]
MHGNGKPDSSVMYFCDAEVKAGRGGMGELSMSGPRDLNPLPVHAPVKGSMGSS